MGGAVVTSHGRRPRWHRGVVSAHGSNFSTFLLRGRACLQLHALGGVVTCGLHDVSG